MDNQIAFRMVGMDHRNWHLLLLNKFPTCFTNSYSNKNYTQVVNCTTNFRNTTLVLDSSTEQSNIGTEYYLKALDSGPIKRKACEVKCLTERNTRERERDWQHVVTTTATHMNE